MDIKTKKIFAFEILYFVGLLILLIIYYSLTRYYSNKFIQLKPLIEQSNQKFQIAKKEVIDNCVKIEYDRIKKNNESDTLIKSKPRKKFKYKYLSSEVWEDPFAETSPVEDISPITLKESKDYCRAYYNNEDNLPHELKSLYSNYVVDSLEYINANNKYHFFDNYGTYTIYGYLFILYLVRYVYIGIKWSIKTLRQS